MSEGEGLAFSALAKFHPKQVTAFEAMKAGRFVLFGGSRGPGKSYWLRWSLLWLLLYYSKALGIKAPTVGLFCEDYPTLADRQIKRIKIEFPGWLGEVKRTETDGLGFYIKPEYGGGILALRNLDEPSKYMGAEFASIGIDQLEKQKLETFDILRGSLRWPGIPAIWRKFLGSANPGGVGHGWVKGFWVDRLIPKRLQKYRKLFAFVPALPDDNPSLDQDYWDELDSLPEPYRSAWRYGDWSVFAGQVFVEFRTETHVCAPFDIPSHWTIVRGLDWGYQSPFACVWLARNPDNGRIYLYREAYETKYTDRRQARLIRDMTPDYEKIRATYADPSMWTKKNMEDQTFSSADEYRAEGVILTRADNDRIQGVRKLHELMANLADGKPGLMVFEDCVESIRTLSELVGDPANPEDVDTRSDDHLYDALRYGTTSFKPSKGVQVDAEQLRARVMADPIFRGRREGLNSRNL